MNRFKEGLKPPSLIRILKNVLDQNPDNGQILKELLQNAEDAGATEVKFLLDWTTHEGSPRSLHHPDLVKFQGPALYAYNNAEFSDDDWAGICMVNHSIKEKDPKKIGRFGVGFKSVFHMTDFPGILTGPGIGFIDPYERYFVGDKGHCSSCHAWHLKTDRRKIKSIIDQFNPFLKWDHFGTSQETLEGGYYKGKTLFRFPLRSAPTELSETIYTPERIKELFHDLEKDAHIVLLFMKNLQQIGIYEKTTEGQIVKILEVKVTDASLPLVLKHRQKFTQAMEKTMEKAIPASVVFPIEIEMTKPSSAIGAKKTKGRWMVSQYYGQDLLLQQKKLSSISTKLAVLPLAGAAFDVTTMPRTSDSGRIFCFLPLPLEEECPTGFAFHVHGTFALDQSRQHVKWPNADQEHRYITDFWILWNIFLRETLIPAAISQLALKLIQEFPDKPDIVYSLMPDLEKVRPNWKPLAESFYKEALNKQHRLFYAHYEKQFHPITGASVIDSADTPHLVSQFLQIAGIHPIILPDHVLTALVKYRDLTKRVSPSLVADRFRKYCNRSMLSDEMKFELLAYLLERETDSRNLVGIELVPLADGSWTIFERHVQQKEKLLYQLPEDTELQRICLLPGPSQHFIRTGLPSNIKEGLERKKREGILHTEPFGVHVFVFHLLTKIEGIAGSDRWIVENGNQHVTLECLEVIWRFLRNNISSNLAHGNSLDFQTLERLQLHLIPVNGCQQLVALTRTKPVLQTNESTERELVELFKMLGIEILENSPHFVTIHPLVCDQYIFPFTARGVFRALQRAVEVQGRASLTDKILQAPDQCKDLLRKFFARNDSELCKFSPDNKNFLKSFPIFLTLRNSGFSESHFKPGFNIKGVQFFPKGITVPEFLLDLDEPDSMNCARLLDIPVANNTSAILEYVFPGINGGQYQSTILENTMKAIFQFYLELINNRSQPFFAQLQRLKFIQKNANEYTAACDLFDDQDPAVVALFEGQEKFPVGEFAKLEYRETLKKIGLRGNENIRIEDLVVLAREIHANPNEQMAERLMMAIKLKAASFKDPAYKAQKKDIQKYKWIKPRTERGQKYPESLKFVKNLASPSRIYSDEYILLVGSVVATIKTKDKWENLANLFDWNEKPKIEDVTEHFLNVIDWYQIQSVTNSSGIEERSRTSESNFQKLAQGIFEELYTFLEEALKATDNQMKRFKKLSEKPCILVDTQLMPPHRCAFESDCSQSYLPHMCCLPNSLSRPYSQLMRALGVKKSFQAGDYIDILQDFHDCSRENPLDHDRIKLVLYIINECLVQFDLTKKLFANRKVYIPDDKKILHPSSEMWYGPTSEETCNTQNCSLTTFPCHPGIKEHAVNKLGIQSKAKALLAPYVEPFGQKEKITARLKRFLESNPYGMETLKEIIQNADDAGATKLHFIIDGRQLPDQRIFDDNWKPLQGPALSIFSDSQFTEADLQGIQDLGEGSKAMDLTKIGQYGVGFNCVYHLSDAPTILTQVANDKKLCVLDPMCKHIPFATTNSPGCMLRDLDKLKELFPDVFAGYLQEFGIDRGTVFRFPLRKQPSSISEQVLSIHDLESSLAKLFAGNIHDYLLFLRNVSEIGLKRVNQKTNNIEDILTVTKEMSKEAQERLQTFQARLKQYAAVFQKEKINHLPTSEQIDYELLIKDSRGKQETWIIVQRLGFEQLSQLSEPVRKSYDSHRLNQLPHVGVAYLLNSSEEGHERKSRVFCFLPLPVFTDLPVHINGHFALDHDNRRALLNEEIGGQKKGWNPYLLKHIVAPAYCSLIVAVKEKIKSNKNIVLQRYHKLFPPVRQCDERTGPTAQIEHLVSLALYERIGTRNLEVLPVTVPSLGGTQSAILWFKPTDGKDFQTGYFDSLSVDDFFNSNVPNRRWFGSKHDTSQRKAEAEFREILTKCGFNLFTSPFEIYENFIAAKVKVKKISPETVLQFFAGKNENSFSAFAKSDLVSSICKILEYCSQWPEFKEQLQGTPLLVTQNGRVAIFDEKNLRFVSKHSEVVPHVPDTFIHNEIAKAAKLSTSAGDTDKKTDSRLCKHFGIPDFAELLPLLLTESEFRGLDKKVTTEFLYKHLATILPSGNNNEKETPWIQRVWNFLGAEVASRNLRRKSSTLSIAKFAMECLSPLNQWCLLPVTSETERDILISIENSSTIMTASIMQQLDANILNVLKKLGLTILKIDKGVRETDATWLLGLLLDVDNQHPSAGSFVARVMRQLLLRELPEIQKEEQATLLDFLSQHVSEIEKLPDFLAIFIKLPYFELFDGTHASLSGQISYILPQNIEEAESKVWIAAAQEESQKQRQKIQFLRYNASILDLVRKLGCKEMSITEVYCSFIFKHFSKMSACAQFFHIRSIKDNNLTKVLPPGDSRQLQVALRVLKFIRNESTGELHPASSYVDPRVEIFKKMEDNSSFPPKPFTTDEWTDRNGWLDFLVGNCGLPAEASESKLLEYARRIATTLDRVAGNKELTVLKEKSDFLLEAILKNKKLSQQFVQEIRTVPFIFQHVLPDEIQTLYPQPAEKTIPFSGSYASLCSDCVWSGQRLLPPAATFSKSAVHLSPYEKSLLQNLGVKLDPSLDDTIKHLQRICSRVSPFREMDRVLKAIFAVLDKTSLSSEVVARINQIRCIKTKKEFLVKPSQVVVSASQEIEPYMYELPIDLGNYHRLLMKFGVCEEPTLSIYSNILSDLYKKNSEWPLQPDQRRAAIRAVRGLFECLDTMTETDIESSLGQAQLYLLCSDGHLHPTTDVVFLDDRNISVSRLQHFRYPVLNLNSLTLSNIKNTADNCLKKIPRRLSCKFFTSFVKEKLRENAVHSVADQGPQKFVDQLQKLIRTPEFADGFIRLIKHAQISSTQPETNSLTIAQIQDKLSACRIRIVDNVITYLVEDGGYIIPESDEDGSFFSENNTIYISKEFCSSQSRDILFIRIAKVLNSITGNVVEPALVYVPLILKCRPSEISLNLDESKISRDIDNESNYDTADENDDFSSNSSDNNSSDSEASRLDTDNRHLVGNNLQVSGNTPNRQMTTTQTRYDSEEDQFENIYQRNDPFSNVDRLANVDDEIDETDSQIRRYPQRISKDWLRQAQYDLQSGQSDARGHSYEWSCYKFHQAAEKAIKAVLIQRGRPISITHNLIEVSEELADSEIKTAARQLQHSLRNTSAMRYPSQDGTIPHDWLDVTVSNTAERGATKILEWAKSRVPLR